MMCRLIRSSVVTAVESFPTPPLEGKVSADDKLAERLWNAPGHLHGCVLVDRRHVVDPFGFRFGLCDPGGLCRRAVS
jgi:hypothetical protein